MPNRSPIPIFTLEVPEGFELVKTQRTSLHYSDFNGDHEHQPPFVEVSLFHIESIAQQKGDTFLEQYISWSEDYQSHVTSTEQATILGHPAYIVHAKTDATFQQQHFRITYLNACILLDDVWCIDLQFTYETRDADRYQAAARTCLQSLTISGNADDWLQAHMEDARRARARLNVAKEENMPPKEATPPAFSPPEDGGDYIRLGGFDFAFVDAECHWRVIEYFKHFYVQIRAQTHETKLATKKGLLSEFGGYELDGGEIELSFACHKVYRHGIPTIDIDFEGSKSGAPQFISLSCNGLDLEFFGRVTLRDGWVGIQGVFKKSYQEKPQFNIDLYKRLPTDNLDWRHYQHSLPEALQASPEEVLYLVIDDYDNSAFPDEVVTFTNLRKLRIQCPQRDFDPTIMPLAELPETIANLTQLSELAICQTGIQSLPDTIGQLSELEHLTILGNPLSHLPDGIFRLPKLKYLFAGSNQIEKITADIALPALSRMDLEHNQLTTLPVSLAAQPELKSLSLNGNPLQFLPAEFNRINIDLDINDKRRLLDHSYPGADGSGVAPWDNAPYLATNDPALKTVLDDSVRGTVLEKYQPALERLALKAVGITTTDADDYSGLGNTRFGGLPDLPQGTKYPAYERRYLGNVECFHYIFIAQLNCEELTPYQDYLPRSGILYFYLEDEESFGCHVVYHPDAESLESAKDSLDDTLNIFDSGEPYAPFKTDFSPFVALPAFYSDEYWYQFAQAPEMENLEDFDHADYKAFYKKDREELYHKLKNGGQAPSEIDAYLSENQHSINDYVFTQHESPQERAALKLKGNPEDWMVLLKVTSDRDSGFCFWDAGELFFVIHKSDLAKQDFSNIYASIETS